MKKMLYITKVDFDAKSHRGFAQKIKEQVIAFEKEGLMCDLIYMKTDLLLLKTSNGEEIQLGKLRNNYEKTLGTFKIIKNYIDIKNYDLYYIRYPLSSFQFLEFCKYLKNDNKHILIEIPTYPYKGELKLNRIKNIIKFILDAVFNKKLKDYIDYIVTFSNENSIFDVKCINIDNGINIEKINLKNNLEHEGITFTSVSACEYWHGIDRFLLSLKEYLLKNGNTKVKFNIIGDGTQTEYLKKIVEDNSILKEYVEFFGYLNGGDLEKVYNITDIGIGSLARHRSGIKYLKPLKNVEYAAVGLPFVISEIDLAFEEVDFVYNVPANEELINIDDIIIWFNNMKVSNKDIRKYSMKFSWDNQVKKILDTIYKDLGYEI